MTRRPWLRHPARTLHQPTTCPSEEQRYRTADHAQNTAASLAAHGWGPIPQPEPCDLCRGWHLTRP